MAPWPAQHMPNDQCVQIYTYICICLYTYMFISIYLYTITLKKMPNAPLTAPLLHTAYMNNIHWTLLIANAQAYICDVCTLERYEMCTDICVHLHSVHISYLYLHRKSHWWHPCFALHTFPLHWHIFVSRHCIVCNAYIHEPTHDALQMSPLIHTTCCMLQFLHFTI